MEAFGAIPFVNSLSTNPAKWSNTLQRRQQPTSCLSVFNHFVGLTLKRLYFFILRRVLRALSIIYDEAFAKTSNMDV